MRRSAGRISDLVQDLMDLARGQLGTGMRVVPVFCPDLSERLAHIVDEVRAAHPGSLLDFECHLPKPVWCDPDRIVQAAANLLANAVTHGSRGKLITVKAGMSEDEFRFETSNKGPRLAPAEIARLFQPYFRPTTSTAGGGLGLGLYIVSEIAKAHHGTASATTQSAEITFTVRIPREPAA